MIRIKKEKNYGSWRKWEKFWQSSSFTYFFLLFFFWRKEFELKFCFMFCFPKLAYFSFFFLRLILSLVSTWKSIPAPLQGHFPQILYFLPLSLSQWLENNPKAWSFLRSCTSLKSHVDICTVFIFSMSFVEKTTITPVTYKHPKSVQNDQIMSRQIICKVNLLDRS